MYTLLHGLYKYLVQKDEYFILILGLDNAGKTVRNEMDFPLVVKRINIHEHIYTHILAIIISL